MDDWGRPMQVLLVSGDDGYAGDVLAVGDAVGVDVTVMDGGGRLTVAVRRIGADAVVFDAQEEFSAVADEARAFAILNPDVVVAVVAKGVEDDDTGDLVVQHRWRTPERLLDALVSANRRNQLRRRQPTFIA